MIISVKIPDMNNRILVLFTTLFLGVGIATAEDMQKSSCNSVQKLLI